MRDIVANEVPGSARRSTDVSLQCERSKTDRELAKNSASSAEESDAAVDAARKHADAVQQVAREAAGPPVQRQAAVVGLRREQAHADANLSAKREAEDAALDLERRNRSEALAALFRLERDQTDLHLLTERARSDDAVATRDTFLAMVAHDLRAMLQGISLTASRLATDEEAARGTTGRARAETIQRFVGRMNKLVGDLVDVTAVEAGRLLVLPERRDLVRLVREADDGAQPLAASRSIAFSSEIRGRPRVAPFDHERLLQVLANVVTNAIKFTPEGGRVELRVEERDGMCLFAVADTGLGIAPENLEAIFERFWQVGRRDRRGLGLGLYISKNIVEAHGGRMWAESTPGEGSTIFFTLPPEPARG